MNKDQKTRKLLKPIVWDYDIEPDMFYDIALGKVVYKNWFDQDWALVRIFERLGWYELLDLFGMEFIKQNLTPDRISKLRFKEMRDRYDLIRRLLCKETVSFSGWNPENRKRLEHTLLSHRWYRTKSFLS